MKIPEFGTLQMMRTQRAHYGNFPIFSQTENIFTGEISGKNIEKTKSKFEDYILDAVKVLNGNQMEVEKLQQKVITEPDSVDIHDVTIAMSKARMSLNLAQSVIDRLVQGWSEITTSR